MPNVTGPRRTAVSRAVAVRDVVGPADTRLQFARSSCLLLSADQLFADVFCAAQAWSGARWQRAVDLKRRCSNRPACGAFSV